MQSTMSKYDQQRKDKCVKWLGKSKEALEEASLYLQAKEVPPMEEIYSVDDALEHVNIALERLGVSVEGGEEV